MKNLKIHLPIHSNNLNILRTKTIRSDKYFTWISTKNITVVVTLPPPPWAYFRKNLDPSPLEIPVSETKSLTTSRPMGEGGGSVTTTVSHKSKHVSNFSTPTG